MLKKSAKLRRDKKPPKEYKPDCSPLIRSFQSVQNRRQTNARQESSMYTNTIEMLPEDDEEEKKEENSSQNFEVDPFRRSRTQRFD